MLEKPHQSLHYSFSMVLGRNQLQSIIAILNSIKWQQPDDGHGLCFQDNNISTIYHFDNTSYAIVASDLMKYLGRTQRHPLDSSSMSILRSHCEDTPTHSPHCQYSSDH